VTPENRDKEITVHVRITTINGATNIDAGIRHLRDVVVPQAQEDRGFRGLTASGDRAAGIVSVLTLWDTREDLDASESSADKLRAESMAAFGGSNPSVERYEQTLDVIGPQGPTVGSRLQIRWVKMDPSLVDGNIEFFKNNVLPEISSFPGFQGLRQLTDRATGEGAVGVIWADHEALADADASLERRRDTAASRGVQFGVMVEREVLFAAMR
jgi:heme-degrading monooxygenase HmoA